MKELDLNAILNAGKESENHKAGFVALVGKPNSGKSTLMNTVLGEKLAIVTPKAQTTRHRIMGILNSEDYQIIFSDTPGIISPKYELHEKMMRFVEKSLEDADVILLVTSLDESHDEENAIEKLRKALDKKKIPLIVILNKTDLVDQEIIDEKIARWKEVLNPQEILPISALMGFNVDDVLDAGAALPAPSWPARRRAAHPRPAFARSPARTIRRPQNAPHTRRSIAQSCGRKRASNPAPGTRRSTTRSTAC